MKPFLKYSIYLLLILSVPFITGCKNISDDKKKIALIHSYEKGKDTYPLFNEILEKTFHKQKIDADIYPFYLDSQVDQNQKMNERMYQFLDSIKKIKPDILLVNDNDALDYLLSCGHPLAKQLPVVFAGISYPDWERLKDFPNITGWQDKHDFIKNIEFMHDLFGQLKIKVDCVDTPMGEKTLYDLLAQIKTAPHIELIRWNTYLMSHPELVDEQTFNYMKRLREITADGANSSDDADPESIGYVFTIPYRNLPSAHILSAFIRGTGFAYLEINRDYLSDAMCQQVDYPALTAYNESVQYEFFPKNNRYIGGYLTSVEIQAKEQAETASLILRGTPARQIPFKEHSKEYIMVWHAIKAANFPLEKIPPYVRLVNVPFYELYKQPLTISTSIIFILICTITLYLWRMWLKEQTHKETAQAQLFVKNQELEAALLRALESDRLKSAFLANMSHEIRTPLNAIVGFSNILNSDIEIDQEEKERFIELVNINSDLLLNLINDILDLSRIESGRMTFVFTEFPLKELMMEIYQTYHILMPENVKLLTELPEKDILLSTDKHRLMQVINNFINNAIKFTKNGYIKVGFKPMEQEQICIFVEDTGIGIPKEKQETIFNRFSKLDEYAKGTGLGLSICKVIAEYFGGHIEVQSEVGKGSHFSIVIPQQCPKAGESK